MSAGIHQAALTLEVATKLRGWAMPIAGALMRGVFRISPTCGFRCGLGRAPACVGVAGVGGQNWRRQNAPGANGTCKFERLPRQPDRSPRAGRS